ncbi:MAG TPA: hypothetical protein VFK06_00625 [Candidatus Angelobacter sp.]|nr:hypothetical protein [Candidatus Angelobacter sp.]
MRLFLTQIIDAIRPIVSESHMPMTVVLGVLASFATAIQNLSIILEFQSLESRTKQEKDLIRENTELLATLQSQTPEETSAARKQLEEEISLSLGRLVRLTEASCKAREDPNHDLSLFQRLFILFAPRGQRATVIHVLAYTFVAMLTMLVALLVVSHTDSLSEGYADLIVFSGYCALAFRSWALSERRWRFGYNPTDGLRRSLFILRAPVNQAMLLAQICFWASNFWIVEGIEDIVQDALEGKRLFALEPVLLESILKLAAPLLAAVLCRKWAFAEVKQPKRIPSLRMRKPVWNSNARPSWLLVLVCLAELGVSIANLFVNSVFSGEALHQWALVFESTTSLFASLVWLSLADRSQITAVAEGAARSAAAEYSPAARDPSLLVE